MADRHYVVIISEKIADKLEDATNSALAELEADNCEIKDIQFVIDAVEWYSTMIVYTHGAPLEKID